MTLRPLRMTCFGAKISRTLLRDLYFKGPEGEPEILSFLKQTLQAKGSHISESAVGVKLNKAEGTLKPS